MRILPGHFGPGAGAHLCFSLAGPQALAEFGRSDLERTCWELMRPTQHPHKLQRLVRLFEVFCCCLVSSSCL